MFPMKLLLIRPSFYVTTVSQSMAKCLMGYTVYAGMSQRILQQMFVNTARTKLWYRQLAHL